MSSIIDPPTTFVDWIGVTNILQHAATGGVRTIIISQLDGSLLAIAHAASSSGNDVSNLPASIQLNKQNSDSILASLVASIWQNHSAFGSSQQDLQSLVMDFDRGQILVSKLGSFLLSIVASSNSLSGMLRGKAMTLLHSLRDLQEIA